MKRIPCQSWMKWGVCGMVMALGLSACGWFDDPRPETVRLAFDGDAGKEVEIVVSQRFAARNTEAGGTVVNVATADTLFRTLPWDTIVRLQGGNTALDPLRFFFQVKRLDEGVNLFAAEAYLDDELKFEASGTLLDAEVYLWAFTFNQAIGEIEEVL